MYHSLGMNILFTLLTTLIVCNKALCTTAGKQRPVHPALAAWWRGLNADHNLIRDFPEFIDRLFADPVSSSSQHKAFAVSRRYRDTLAFTVPMTFFAYAKGFDIERFVKANQRAVNGGESAARIYALAFRILLAASPGNTNSDDTDVEVEADAYGVKEKDMQTKNSLLDAFSQLSVINNLSRPTNDRFQPYQVLFAKFYKPPNTVLSPSKFAKEQVIYAFRHFNSLALHPESELCRDSSPNNVKRALLFALHFASTGEHEDPCRLPDIKYPPWLYELTDLLHGDTEFNKRLMIPDARGLMQSELSLEELRAE